MLLMLRVMAMAKSTVLKLLGVVITQHYPRFPRQNVKLMLITSTAEMLTSCVPDSAYGIASNKIFCSLRTLNSSVLEMPAVNSFVARRPEMEQWLTQLRCCLALLSSPQIKNKSSSVVPALPLKAVVKHLKHLLTASKCGYIYWCMG